LAIIEREFVNLTADLDVEAFWEENARCQAFTTDKPRCALSFSPDDHWIFEFIDIPSTLHYYQDKPYRDALHRKVNEVLRDYVGRAYFDEDTWEHSPKRIENLFGCYFTYHENSTPWLTPVTDDPDEFAEALIGPRLSTCARGPSQRNTWRNGKRGKRRASTCHSWVAAAAVRRQL
jgi:hypothetical protein